MQSNMNLINYEQRNPSKTMRKEFSQKLLAVLKTDRRFTDESGALLNSVVIEHAYKMDHDLLRLLLSDAEIKEIFFTEIDEHWVFNTTSFVDYMANQHFLANSYTRFRNRIGLNIDGKCMQSRGEVALDWPYKDCVLAGGQSSEKEKRDEIFFNEILARDEINHLFAKKVLTNWRRYNANGMQEVGAIKRNEQGVVCENLVIKGNNLVVLHALKQQFGSAVKLVYIDPPYNTGSDSFHYNDNFNHSSWLTFMKNRLEVVRELLRDDGVIFVQCDDNEQAYLKVLMDEIFGRKNFIHTISIRTGDSKRINAGDTGRLVKKAEFIMVYQKQYARLNLIHETVSLTKLIREKELNGKPFEYNRVLVSYGKKKYYKSIRDGKGEEIKIYQHTDHKIMTVREYAKQNSLSTLEVCLNSTEKMFQTAVSASNILKKVQQNTDREFYSLSYMPKSGKNKGKITERFFYKHREVIFLKNTLTEIDGEYHKTTALSNIWTDLSWHSVFTEGGVTLPGGKKPEALLKRIIELSTQPGDLVLDYHLGSGTTAAVAHKMQRHYIGIEQMDYIETFACTRLKKVIGCTQADSQPQALPMAAEPKGKYRTTPYDMSGISKLVNWQGGGDFIYCELMHYNQIYRDKIQAAQCSEDLLALWRAIAENSFLNWYVNPAVPNEAEAEFQQIGKQKNGIAKQRNLLTELLNTNQLYVNLSEINDRSFGISKQDKLLNSRFYRMT